MFAECSSLTSLNLSSFNTQNVTVLAGMFQLCQSLTSLDLSSFNTKNVISMGWMFRRCHSSREVNLSSFDNTNAQTTEMFDQCLNLFSCGTYNKIL